MAHMSKRARSHRKHEPKNVEIGSTVREKRLQLKLYKCKGCGYAVPYEDTYCTDCQFGDE